jgi:hypothetical protein
MNFLLTLFTTTLSSLAITCAAGLLYFAIASLIVNGLGLNYGSRPIGLYFFNFASLATFVTFIIVFAYIAGIK